MDNLTHSLTGFALARSGLDRLCPHATLLMILAANAPDLDIVALQGGPLRYLEWHRGYSHSVPCLPLMALLPVLAVGAIYRQKLPWMRAWLLCCIAVASTLGVVIPPSLVLILLGDAMLSAHTMAVSATGRAGEHRAARLARSAAR